MKKIQLEEAAAALGRAGAFGGNTFKQCLTTPKSAVSEEDMVTSIKNIIKQDEKEQVSAEDTLLKLKIMLSITYPRPADNDPN